MGYLKDPESTARVFVANPFAELGCPTLYRTGDLARFREDGIIEYLGRIDHQVKIRGIRIELGEIETCLRKSPGVRQAAVLVQEDHSGHKSLVAYLVAEQPGKIPDAAGVRTFLGEKLPSYLIPSRFLMLDSLPLTSSGKVDRKAIGGMAGTALQPGSPHEAPRNDLERQIVEIWQELLGRPQVGIHDHFFELGGDSLMAIRFVSRFRECTGLSIEVRSLYDSPTPAGLSARVDRVGGAADVPDVGLLEGVLARQRPLVATWRGRQASPDSLIFTLNDTGSRRGLFWCFQGYQELEQLALSLGPDQPLHGMRSGYLIMDYTDANIDALAGHYAREMVALQPAGPFVIAGNCQAASIARAIALALRQLGRSVDLLVLMEESSFREYDGRVVLLFGRESTFNPYKPGADPEAVFRKSYPGGFSVHLIAGGHGQYFGEPNIASLGDTLRQLLLPVPGQEA
jgi:acyl carrier protein